MLIRNGQNFWFYLFVCLIQHLNKIICLRSNSVRKRETSCFFCLLAFVKISSFIDLNYLFDILKINNVAEHRLSLNYNLVKKRHHK